MSRKYLSRIADSHSESQKLALTSQCAGEVNSSKDHKVRSPGVTFDKDTDVVLSSLTLRSIVSNFTRARFEHRYCVSAYNSIQLFSPETAEREARFLNEKLGTDVWSLNQRGERYGHL